jgi:hypothetical protein
MDRPEPPIGSIVYDEEGIPMRVIKLKDGIVTLHYEGIAGREYYRLMGLTELYERMLCEEYPPGIYDVVVEVRARKVVRVTHNELGALSMDMVQGTNTPPIPLSTGYEVCYMRPVQIVAVSAPDIGDVAAVS